MTVDFMRYIQAPVGLKIDPQEKYKTFPHQKTKNRCKVILV